MSLMWKLLATTLLLSSLAEASTTGKKIEKFLNNEFGNNPRISKLDVKVVQEEPLKQLKGWRAYIVAVKAVLKNKQKQVIQQKMIWFSNGQVITKELTDLAHGESFTDMVKPNFQNKDYKKENLIYGNANAKHKVAIFSDPMCPFCKDFTPKALEYMKKYPKRFAVYYYHFPLIRIHPASATVVRAAIVAQRQGVKDVAIKMYSLKISPRERNVDKILAAFNKTVSTHITKKEIQNPTVEAELKSDEAIASNVFVRGTPTIYLDNKLDKSRAKYKTIK